MKLNTMTEKEYVLLTLIWAGYVFAWYDYFFFTEISGITPGGSRAILITMLVFTIVINVMCTMSWRRNNCSVITMAFAPFGIYAYITFGKIMSKTCRVIGSTALAAGMLSIACILVMKVRGTSRKKRAVSKIKMTYLTVRLISAAASLWLIISLFCRLYVEETLLLPSIGAIVSCNEDYTVAGNIDTVLLLQKDKWKELNLEERIDVLQCISNIEKNSLGINKKIHLLSAELEGDVLGYYNDPDSVIYISVHLLEAEDPQKALDTLCHEMFHAAQYRYLEIYEGLDAEAKNSFFFRNASVYEKEFMNYKEVSDMENAAEYDAYYGQRCEYDAREYAAQQVLNYYMQISDHLSGT